MTAEETGPDSVEPGWLRDLRRALPPGAVLDDWLHRLVYARDASVYRLVPRAVARPADESQVRSLLDVARRHRAPLTFRAAGTSLSGQAVTRHLLVDLSRSFREAEVLDGGLRVRVQPGARGGDVNRDLARFHRKLGPDPASIQSCMMGGILANNSSGMCCGVHRNAYHTLERIRAVLADGAVFEYPAPSPGRRLEAVRPEVARGLLALRSEVLAKPGLAERIRRKYAMKNTMGYALNAFVEYETPEAVLAHLLIGSEGTLGFIAEAELHTVPDPPEKLTGLLFFPGVPEACQAIVPLRACGAEALELMDRASLRAVEDRPGVPGILRDLPDGAAALLVEFQADDAAGLDEARRVVDALPAKLTLAADPEFTRDPERQLQLWAVRKGLIASVGAERRPGTSFIIEDVVFPVEALAAGVADLQDLLRNHGYGDAVVFGHAKDGNLHFVLTQSFDSEAEVDRYDRFMRDLAELVVGRYEGALKAEHGTGRNMAPFLEREWGPEAVGVMRGAKALLDPDGILNPGVLLNDDPRLHVRDLKPLPRVDAAVDGCIECGFCERVCPSRQLTLTPRQRIVASRELALLEGGGGRARRIRRQVQRGFRYAGDATCAADGLCAVVCPVDIDTGAFVKDLRARRRGAASRALARGLARRFRTLERVARAILFGVRLAARGLGGGRLYRWSGALNRWTGRRAPVLDGRLAPAPRLAPPGSPAPAEVIHFPACVHRVLGCATGAFRSVPEAVAACASRASVGLSDPCLAEGHCCGLAFASKGFADAAAMLRARTLRMLQEVSKDGRLPVLVDASPCAQVLKEAVASDREARPGGGRRIEILDTVEFAERFLLARGRLRPVTGRVFVHPVCSITRMGLVSSLRRVAEACSEEVVMPGEPVCCGAGGDRAWHVPELARAAQLEERRLLERSQTDVGFSTSRTCEIALARACGVGFEPLWHLLAQAAVPDADPAP